MKNKQIIIFTGGDSNAIYQTYSISNIIGMQKNCLDIVLEDNTQDIVIYLPKNKRKIYSGFKYIYSDETI